MKSYEHFPDLEILNLKCLLFAALENVNKLIFINRNKFEFFFLILILSDLISLLRLQLEIFLRNNDFIII